MKFTPTQVKQFLNEHFGEAVPGVTPLTGGEWSQAFAFTRKGNAFVVRFGQHRDDYLKDKFACGFVSPELPIPKVLEVASQSSQPSRQPPGFTRSS